MSSPVLLPSPDEQRRRTAIDPARSFAVQAPAGSGKTELLIQRVLRLLAIVERPEAIVAITFTRKAAAEMLERILDALRNASEGTAVAQPHERLTRDLAAAVLERDRALEWNLLDHPGRLRVQTIDALCLSIAGEMPWLSRLGAMPRIEEDTRAQYEEAARRTVLLIGGEPRYREPLETLLRHLDNNAPRLQQLLADMLAKRDQWLPLAVETDENERARIEGAMSRARVEAMEAAERAIPATAREAWLAVQRFLNADTPGMASVLLTEDGWRKRGGLNKTCGFPPGSNAEKDLCSELIARLDATPGVLDALKLLRKMPPLHYTTQQWPIVRALLAALKMAAGQLRVVFHEEGAIDFCELGDAARRALGSPGNPSDLAFRLDSRIEHLLVDEFQDTSRVQVELLERLTTGWQPGDGRTLFLVGDPMQSIYRFRGAEVGLFLQSQRHGIGGLPVETLRLEANYRSVKSIVERVNDLFLKMFPKIDDISLGAIRYSAIEATQPDQGHDPGVVVHGFGEHEEQLEADKVIELVRNAKSRGSVAILVRARTHLPWIVDALKKERIHFQAVEIDPLNERTTVQDLLALTRAMLHASDRISWLAILRAPWCGLTLADLEALVRGRTAQTIWDSLQNIAALSEDGQRRAARLREALGDAFTEQGRWPLRRWVERAWIKLGGPACLEGDESALEDARDYFDLLEAEQTGSDVRDFDALSRRVTQLYAKSAPDPDPWLHVMTIHKAKGLEFDTVIVPGLGSREKIDDAQLFLFHEWPSDNGEQRLIAPIPAGEGEKDPLYKYLQEIEKRKNRLERVRQLYVAATRAKKRLHLLGSAKAGKDGEPHPHKGSMLYDLWPALTEEERECFRRDAVQTQSAAGTATAAVLRRLPEDWTLPTLPSPVDWEGAGPLPMELRDPTYEWVGDSLRHAGTVVHALLQRAPGEDLQIPEPRLIRKALAHAGVTPAEIEDTARRVQQALQRMKTSPRGQWILRAHKDARSEYAITGVVAGEVVRGTVDRTFIDEKGVRWIIDFKNSSHEGGGLETFLDEEQRRYRDQLERYARLFAPLGQPVRLGLYFPLLDGWREWAPQPDA
jgi:ATP-dependent exoDNAse (exonuclease V) beta subunit